MGKTLNICELWVKGTGTRDCATVGFIEYQVGTIDTGATIPSLVIFDVIDCAGAAAQSINGTCGLWVKGVGTPDCVNVVDIEYQVGTIAIGSSIPSLQILDVIYCDNAPAFRPSGYTRYTLSGYSGFVGHGYVSQPTLSKRNCTGGYTRYTLPSYSGFVMDGWSSMPTLEKRNCGFKCTEDSCRVDCATSPDGFCCIDHSVTNRLLQVFSSL